MATNPYMPANELKAWEEDSLTVEYAGYTIKPKRDFPKGGIYDAKSRSNIDAGWVVVKGGCNALPGATWAHSTEHARGLISAMVIADGDANKFWAVLQAVRALSNVKVLAE